MEGRISATVFYNLYSQMSFIFNQVFNFENPGY